MNSTWIFTYSRTYAWILNTHIVQTHACNTHTCTWSHAQAPAHSLTRTLTQTHALTHTLTRAQACEEEESDLRTKVFLCRCQRWESWKCFYEFGAIDPGAPSFDTCQHRLEKNKIKRTKTEKAKAPSRNRLIEKRCRRPGRVAEYINASEVSIEGHLVWCLSTWSWFSVSQHELRGQRLTRR